MNIKKLFQGGAVFVLALVLSAGLASANSVGSRALGSGFTYQGQLKSSDVPYTGSCDLQFKLYDSLVGGIQVGSTQTLMSISISEGYFTVVLDFGSAAFNGEARWLEIAVRCPAGSGTFQALMPRQALTAAPYAWHAQQAGSTPWSGITGMPGGFLDGVDNDTQYSAGTGLTLAGTTFSADTAYLQRRVSGTCAVDNAIRLINADGTVTCQAVSGSGGWALTGNAGTSPTTNYLGTSDNVALELRVNGLRALRLEPHATSPNILAGSPHNKVSAGVYGAVIAGGGADSEENVISDIFGVVAGGKSNQAGNLAGDVNDSAYCTVSGGSDNKASGIYSSIGGGYNNLSSGGASSVGGGNTNLASSQDSSIAGGSFNTASGIGSSVGGGSGNIASGDDSSVGGGEFNEASGVYATVSGGRDNLASSVNTTVGGGEQNIASGDSATVGGGSSNLASGDSATVGGGSSNLASGHQATVSGGIFSLASGSYATVGGGYDNTASGNFSSLSGGGDNAAIGFYSSVGGGYQNAAIGVYSSVGGGFNNIASGAFSALGGGAYNTASGDSSTLDGGQNNTASNELSSVGGGGSNTASGEQSTVGGGYGNTASGDDSTVSGGASNSATGDSSIIGGGYSNIASGYSSTIPGGVLNFAQGDYSLAAGSRAKAYNTGCFVWGDSTNADVTCSINDRWVARASGGVYFYSSSNLSTGAFLAAGGGSWASVSDRNLKENVAPVEPAAVLAALMDIPISTWNYPTQDESIRHIGPMAQDFYAAFGVGENETSITTIDADGVALAAIQGLYAENQALKARVDDLETRLEALESGQSSSTSAASLSRMMVLGLAVVAGVWVLRRPRGGAL